MDRLYDNSYLLQMIPFLKMMTRTYIGHMKLVKPVCLIVLLNKMSTSTAKTASDIHLQTKMEHVYTTIRIVLT